MWGSECLYITVRKPWNSCGVTTDLKRGTAFSLSIDNTDVSLLCTLLSFGSLLSEKQAALGGSRETFRDKIQASAGASIVPVSQNTSSAITRNTLERGVP